MTDEEVAFIENKKQREMKVFKVVTVICAFICVTVPFLNVFNREKDGTEIPFNWNYYLISLIILILLSCLILGYFYRINLKNTLKDLKEKTKLVETSRVTKKYFMPHNGSYHLYLTSTYRLSIEVDADFFKQIEVGDEVNLEMARYGKQYLGYF